MKLTRKLLEDVIKPDIIARYKNLAKHLKDLKGMTDNVYIKSNLVYIESELGYMY